MNIRSPLIAILMLILMVSCAGRLIEPIAGYSVEHPSQSQSALFANIGEYLSAQGCTQAVSLVGEHLTRTRTKWDPTVTLGSGADFLPTFKLRYGIDYRERRSPVEVETLVEVYEKVRTEIETRSEALGLPPGYRLTEQDKTDLFYVMGPRGSLAIREILEPLLVKEPAVPVDPPITITPPPVNPPVPPIVIPPTIPLPNPVPPSTITTCPECPTPLPVICPPLALSPESLSTLDNLSRWVTGSGHKSKVNKLLREVKDKMRSTGQVNVVVVSPS